jgi:hypothetical protein
VSDEPQAAEPTSLERFLQWLSRYDGTLRFRTCGVTGLRLAKVRVRRGRNVWEHTEVVDEAVPLSYHVDELFRVLDAEMGS